jgi:molybdenum cofactor synthesis domain-containing protein
VEALDSVRRRVLAPCTPRPAVTVRLADAVHCVAAEAVVAESSVPPFENSAMDGFAVRAADTRSAPVVLEVIGTIAAGGAATMTVEAGKAVRIMTGAPVPTGADAVVMVEKTEPAGDSTVRILAAVDAGTSVRPAGDDVVAGQVVMEAGAEVTARHAGVLASVGVYSVKVHGRPRVGVLSTGDELVPEGRPLGPGQIHDSNRAALLALVTDAGAVPVDLGLVGDDVDAVEASITAAVDACDLLLTSGGVSMGDFDPVKVVLRRLAPTMEWLQVAIRPAKPLAFGTIGDVPVIGLPGNPVSSLVSFEMFARPAIRRMLGHPDNRLDGLRVAAVADDDSFARRPDGKTHFVRVVVTYGSDGRFHARSAGGQGSHQLAAMAAANGLAVVDDGEGVPAGGTAPVVLLGEVPVA